MKKRHNKFFVIRIVFLFAVVLDVDFAGTRVLAQTTSKTAFEKPTAQYVQSVEMEARALKSVWTFEAISRSAELFEQAGKFSIKSGDYDSAGNNLNESAELYLQLGKINHAERIATSALQNALRTKNLSAQTKGLSLLAIASIRRAELTRATNFALRAVSTSERTNSPNAKATALFALAQTNYDGNNFNPAVFDFEKALEYWRTSGSQNEQAKTLYELSFAYMTIDELPKALNCARESFEIFSQLGDVRGQNLARISLGVMSAKLGNKQEALNFFHEALSHFPDNVDRLEKGSLCNHLAEIYEDFGDFSASLNLHLKAFDLFEAEGNLYAQLATVSRLGTIYFFLGDEKTGLQFFDRGFKIAAQTKDHYYNAVFMQDLGELYLDRDVNRAKPQIESALKNFRALKIRTHIANSETKLAEIYVREKKFATAKSLFDSALKLNQQTRNIFAEAETRFGIAKLLAAQQYFSDATEQTKQSLSLTESVYSDVLNSNLRRSYASQTFHRYETYIYLLMKLHNHFPSADYDLQALQASERSRSRSMLETMRLSNSDLHHDADKEMVIREKEIRIALNSKSDKLTELLSGANDKSETDKVSLEINDLENQLEEIKAQLKQQSPVYSAIKNPAPFDLADFQQNILDDNSLLLEFSCGEEQSYLWLVGKTEFASYVLPSRSELESHLQNLRNFFKQREPKLNESIEDYQTRISSAENDYNNEARLLSEELFGQVADKIADKRLIIVPDGKLQYFPLGALPFPGSENAQPIIVSNEIVYEPSAQTLSLISRQHAVEADTKKDLLIFSDPVFSEADSRFPVGAEKATAVAEGEIPQEQFRFVESLNSLSRLVSSKAERESITQIIGSSNTDSLDGFSANRENLLNAKTSGYKILHFASHAFVNEERPELSGIVLSRFSQDGQKLDEFFRLHDIYDLNLNADLVVLSACQTGIGKEIRGEGLMSLDNAFLQSGAKSVLSTSWKVDDRATAELMKSFYKKLFEGLTPSAALRLAQLEMLNSAEFKSPFYWAAFSLRGDYRTPISFSRDYTKFLFLLLIPAIVAIFFYAQSRKKNNS